MANHDFLETNHIVPAIIPLADAFAGGSVVTEAVDMSGYSQACLVIITGAIEDSGISNLITMRASDDASATGATTIPYRWRAQLKSGTIDAWSAATEVAATGYNFAVNNAVANVTWYLTVTADEVEAANPGAKWLDAAIAETADKTITAGAIWILTGAAHASATPVGAIV